MVQAEGAIVSPLHGTAPTRPRFGACLHRALAAGEEASVNSKQTQAKVRNAELSGGLWCPCGWDCCES